MKGKPPVEGLVRADLTKSAPASNLAFNEEIKALRIAGRNIYHFAFGLSPFPTPKCMVKGVQEFAHVNEYLPMAGIPELREEVVKFHEKYDKISLDVNNFVVGPGSKELIYLVMVTFSGDILLPVPAWTTYSPQICLAGKTAVLVETNRELGWKLTPEMLAEAADRSSSAWKLLILTNPGNPSGTCYTNEQLSALSEVCRRKSIIVLSDEIYARLTFNRQHATMVKHYPEGTVLTSGFSKWASAGGWRLGYAHFPANLSALMAAVKNGASHTYSCAPAPLQYGVAKAMKEHPDDLDQYMTSCSKILQAVGDYCHRELSIVGVTGTKSEAGYYYMPDFEVVRKGINARNMTVGDHMSKALLEEADVALMSAHAFQRPAEELTTRFCFVCFNGAEALQALETSPSTTLDDVFLRRYCLPIVEGVDNLKKWVLKHS